MPSSSGVRSRSGCARCRTQRLKCDEVWPACGRCRRLGTQCSGPMLRVRWSDKHEVPRPSGGRRQHGSTSSTASSLTPRLDDECSQMRQSSLAHPVIPEVAGSFPDPMAMPDESRNWFQHTLELRTRGPAPLDSELFRLSSSNGQAAIEPDSQAMPLNVAWWDPALDTVSSSTLSADASVSHSPEASDRSFSINSSSPVNIIFPDPSPTGGVCRPLIDYSTILVEYYFKDTAPILALYDSNLNPFRFLVSRFWNSSELLYFTLQSMAAVFLSNTYPQMSSVGAAMRQKAIGLYQTLGEADIDEQALLALFMIGGTASWFDADDTGVKQFLMLRDHVQRMTASGRIPISGGNSHFFKDLLVCWEMFLAFVVDDNRIGSQPSLTPTTPDNAEASIFPTALMPHPLTGVACSVQSHLARVGRLVRTNRNRSHQNGFVTRVAVLQQQDEINEAFRLEAALSAFQPPAETEVVNTGDRQTPSWHLTTLADVYRQVGLLQLYRVFPDVLLSKLGSETTGSRSNGAETKVISIPEANDWMRSFALRIVGALETIPAESGTKDFQPFLLVATCSELSLPNEEGSHSGDQDLLSECMAPGVLGSLEAAQVLQARGFVLSRLEFLQQALPKTPIQRCVDIVKATWDRMDRQRHRPGHAAVYWMDVMIQNGWETFMA